jgi:hypothetical protein
MGCHCSSILDSATKYLPDSRLGAFRLLYCYVEPLGIRLTLSAFEYALEQEQAALNTVFSLQA